jgi:hypothetical protein
VPCTDDLPLAMGLRLKREESLLQAQQTSEAGEW